MTRVIKVGGRAQGDPGLPGALASARAADSRLCVVHGGGDEVSAVQREFGREATFVGGRRVTTADDLTVVRMVLSGTVNKRLVGAFLAAGLPAVGISGEDGGLLQCELFADGAFGLVGDPTRVEPQVIEALLDGGLLPVVSPLGRFIADGSGCNVNGDDAAAAIAVALGADELLLVTDVAGVLGDDGSCLAQVDRMLAGEFIRRGTARGGMVAKLQAAVRALEGGVRQVRIGNLRAIVDPGAGTVLRAVEVEVRGG